MSALGVIGGALGLKDLVLGVLDRIKLAPDKRAEIELALLNNTAELEKAALDFEARITESVGATMRAEAASDSWAQRTWRPTVGFTFSALLINNYILLPYLAKYGVVPLPISPEVWSAMLVILGVAAGTRGLEKWEKAKNGHGPK